MAHGDLTFDGISNFRECGGPDTTDGTPMAKMRVYRSGHLGRASDADLEVLAGLEICTVLDIRSEQDLELEGPDRLPVGAVHRWVTDPSGGDLRRALGPDNWLALGADVGPDASRQMMVDVYTKFVTDPVRCKYFGTVVRGMAGANWPVVIHCSGGKDRTGWACLLLQLICGVPVPSAVADYERSNDFPRPVNTSMLDRLTERGIDPGGVRPLMLADPRYVEAALESVEHHWGGFDQYLSRALELDRSTLDLLRERCLTSGPWRSPVSTSGGPPTPS